MKPTILRSVGLVLLFAAAAPVGCTNGPIREARPFNKAQGHTAGDGMGNIQQIVFIIKENRTFDNYFGTFPGAEGATSGQISTGDTLPLRNVPRIPHDISHAFDPCVTAINGGQMNQFDLIPNGGP